MSVKTSVKTNGNSGKGVRRLQVDIPKDVWNELWTVRGRTDRTLCEMTTSALQTFLLQMRKQHSDDN